MIHHSLGRPFWHGRDGRPGLGVSPVGIGALALPDVVVIVAVLCYLALVVEAQHAHSRAGEFLALLGLAGPPFDRRPGARDDRRPEPALDILLNREVVGEIRADASRAQARLAKWGRMVHRRVVV